MKSTKFLPFTSFTTVNFVFYSLSPCIVKSRFPTAKFVFMQASVYFAFTRGVLFEETRKRKTCEFTFPLFIFQAPNALARPRLKDKMFLQEGIVKSEHCGGECCKMERTHYQTIQPGN